MAQKENRQRAVFLLILCIFACFAWVRQARRDALLSPYQEVDTLEGVWIEAKPGTVTPNGAVIVIHNATERRDFETGVQFLVEEKRGNQWYTIPDSGFSFMVGPLLAISFPTASEIRLADKMRQEPVLGSERREWSFHRRAAYTGTERDYDWTWACGALPPGDYRLLLEVDAADDLLLEGYQGPWYLSAPFTVP